MMMCGTRHKFYADSTEDDEPDNVTAHVWPASRIYY